MILDRKCDKPVRYEGYEVHLSVFLDIAGENNEDFDMDGFL